LLSRHKPDDYLQVTEATENERALSLLPSVLTDYLDLLLGQSTTCPEQGMTRFECIRCQMGDFQMLIPLSRIQKVEKWSEHHQAHLIDIPECEGRVIFVLKLHFERGYLPVQELNEIVWIESKDIKWRDLCLTENLSHSHWFVGTHFKQLCRLFDPDLFFST
jgi:hypothetical protein